ncbi:TPM domain-containing protein [Propionivibrio sp.]|uniref:TPM domain-containing protein n=1 Tax=Propionivibrio sp. TaxID=2212460 RepID=UPI00261E65E3|nr:TPM domain-containing protein [Propionivibrio sp.]
MMIRQIGIIALIASLLPACSREPTLINDAARLLSAKQAASVATFHHYLLADHDIDYRVLTLTQGGDLNRYTSQQFQALKVGSASKGGRGLLLVLDTADNKVRLEVSRSLEAAYPDAFIAYIEQRQMTPFFAAGRVADGILATTELIVTRAQHTQTNQGWDDEVWSPAATAGGGATANARLDGAPVPATISDTPNAQKPGQGDSPLAQNSPEVTLQAYLNAMSTRNASPDLDIYSAPTRAMLKQWVVTPAQMDNIVATYRDCHADAVRYDAQQTLAVIRYPVDERMCSPWFFVRQGDRWQLDLTAMQGLIRFGRDNSWHFDVQLINQHPYQFAFADWGFDNRGYPQKMRWHLTVASDQQGHVWVARTGAGSAAEAFGFRQDDRLLRWNGVALTHHEQAMRAMQDAEAGKPVSVDIIRDQQAMRLEGLAPPRP